MLRIGASSCFFHADPERPIFKGKTLLYLEESLAHWVMSEGALLAMIPSCPTPLMANHYANALDGLILQGGADVSPKSYGEVPLRSAWAGDEIRDRHEIELFRAFTAAGKPVLGVCRGVQLINVALGGTLYQDLAVQRPSAATHRDWHAYDRHVHAIRFTDGSLLGKLHPGSSRVQVNSIHHQAIRKLAPGLFIEAVSTVDGVVEAVRGKAGPWVMGVQWHPEFHSGVAAEFPELLDGKPLLREFLSQARAISERRLRIERNPHGKPDDSIPSPSDDEHHESVHWIGAHPNGEG